MLGDTVRTPASTGIRSPTEVGAIELGEAILAVGAGDRAASFELFHETLGTEWIAQALEPTGTATIRR
jgi:hypothetical protein